MMGDNAMNVIAFTASGMHYLCEFRNDNDKINEIVNKSDSIDELDMLYENMLDCNDDTEFSSIWNLRLNKTIEILENAGCNIIWDT
jgi:hypothetical protein